MHLFLVSTTNKRATGSDFFQLSHANLSERIGGKSITTISKCIRKLAESNLIQVIRTRGCNVYNIQNIQNVVFAKPNTLKPNCQRIKTSTKVDTSYACNPPNLGSKLLQTPFGKHLISRLILLQFDWTVNKHPELSPKHRGNRQRKNQRDVANFVGKYGLQALESVINRCESSSLSNGAAVLHSMITGKLFKSEHEKFLKMRDVA